MEMLEVPSFDEVVVALLGLAGASAGVLGLVGAAFAIYSWYSGARCVVAGVRTAHDVTRRAGATLLRVHPVQVLAAVLVAVIVPLAQVLTLGLCFLGGNYISMIFDEGRWQLAIAIIREDPARSVDPDRLALFLSLDWIAGAYLALAAAVLVASYRRAWRGNDLSRTGALLALPATVLLVVGGPLYLLAIVLNVLAWLLAAMAGDGSEQFREMVQILLPGVIGMTATGLYYGACQAAVRGSRLVVTLWRTPPRNGDRMVT